MRSVVCLFAILLLDGCLRHVRSPDRLGLERSAATSRATAVPSADELTTVLDTARSLVGATRLRVGGRAFRSDCSGFVRAAFSSIDVDLFALAPENPGANGVALIRAFVERRGALHAGPLPAPGDIVFFDDTWDRNGNGRLDDDLTHVGLVDEVRPDGTFLVLHHTRKGIVRAPMSLLHPHDRERNAALRVRTRDEAPGTPHLMGELFGGFGFVGAGDDQRAPRFDELMGPASEAGPVDVD